MHPPFILLECVDDDGLKTIQRAIYLRKAGVETNVDDEFLMNPPSIADLLESAIENLIRYLEVSRNKDLAPSVREGVDTLLMYLYRAINNVHDIEKLASSENSCVVFKKVRDFSPNYSRDPSGKIDGQEKTYVTSGRKTAVVEASNILERSSDQDLVLQYLGWVSDISQVVAVQFLISDKRGNMLFLDAVIAAIDPKKVEILQGYLQGLIEDQNSDDRQYHRMRWNFK